MSQKHPDAQLIEDRGGTTAVAVALDCPPSTVQSWKLKGIPRWWRKQVVELPVSAASSEAA